MNNTRYLAKQMKPLQILSRPYPQILNRWSIIISISLFVSLFLIVFQPFGLQNIESAYKPWILGGYGLVTFVILVLDLVVLPSLLPGLLGEDGWTTGKQLLFLCWIVVTISAGNYLYSLRAGVANWVGIWGFFVFLFFTLLVALIPVSGLTIITYNRMLRKNLAISKQMNSSLIEKPMAALREQDMLIAIASESEKQTITTTLSKLICLESEGNYVTIRYLKDGKLHQMLIRNTMKNIERQTAGFEPLFRCHRAFIVNLLHVEKVTGNSQGYRLKLTHTEKEVPVARSFARTFRNRMSTFQQG